MFIHCTQVRSWRVLLLLSVWCCVKPSDFKLPAQEMLALPACLWLYIDSPAKAVSLHLAARCSPGSFFTPSRLQLSKHAGRARRSSRGALLPLHVCVRCSEMWSCREASGIWAIFLLTPSKGTIFQRIYGDLPALLDKQKSGQHVQQFGIFSSEWWTPAVLLVECCGSLPPACA